MLTVRSHLPRLPGRAGSRSPAQRPPASPKKITRPPRQSHVPPEAVCGGRLESGYEHHHLAEAEAGGDSRPSRRLPVQGRRWAGDLRRQGDLAAQAAGELFPAAAQPAPAHGGDGGILGHPRMGAGAERGGGAPARVQPDQAAPAQVQRALPRRQVVPVAGGDGQRGDSPPSRGARRQAEGHALFRSLCTRLCHPRDARPAAAHLPHAHLLARGVRPPAPARPPVHLVRHQQVLGTVRRPHHAGGAPRDRGRVHLLHGGPQPAGAAAARGGDAGGGRAAQFRGGRPPPGPLASVRKALERQQMVSSSPEDLDIAAFAEDDLEAAVQVFFVRRGRVVGQRGFVVDKVEELDTAALAATFVQQLYGERLDEVPREVLLPVLPEGADALRRWLSGVRGGPVDFRVPQRGEKRALLETVTANARDSFVTHKLKRASDFDARARALKELQEQLDLPVAPLRIECYDISNLQGSQVVGSMVVFEDGLPRKSEYRRFEVRTVDGQDDFASLREVLSRRLARLASEQDDHPAEPAAGAPAEVEPDGLREATDASAPARPETPKQGPRKFAYPPSLIVVDGGRPQLGAAMEALEQAGRTDLAVIGL